MQSIPFPSSADGTSIISSIPTHSLDNAASTSTIPTQPTPPIPPMNPFATDPFPQIASLNTANHFNASARMALEQRHTIRLLASSTSVFSILAATCAVYWFYLMRRNFRRDLVLLLIVGDLWKSLWFLTFACITYTQEKVQSESAVCQVSGYMLQMGIMMCDFAILFMSLHMWLQIFPPQDSFLGHDGLYRIRRWVIAAWLILPNLCAALAFVKGRWAYESGGAFCSLPLRPYWYRLALSWIPRYLIWIFVMGVAIRIYKHVGKEFKVFGQERDRSSSFSIPGESKIDRMADPTTNTMSSNRRKSGAVDHPDLEKQAIEAEPEEENVAPDGSSIREIKSPALPRQSIAESTKSVPRRSSPPASAPDWTATFGFPSEPLTGPQSTKSTSTSRRASRQIASGVLAEDFAPAATFGANNRHRGSITTLNSLRSSASQTIVDETSILPPIIETKRSSASAGVSTAQDLANAASALRRRAIQRQLRLLFIYPCVYMMLWAIPFVVHSMNYSDRFAQHPVTGLVAVNVFCQCFMGFADVVVFSWREKPWRHIPGSDGTFVGSFCFWRFCFKREWVDTVMRRRDSRAPNSIQEPSGTEEKSSSRAGLLSSLKGWSISTSKGPSPRGSEASVPPPSTTTLPAAPHSQDRTPKHPPHRRPTTSHRRAYSGGSDRRHLEAERAHERLAMERADQQQQQHRLSLQEERRRRASGISEPTGENFIGSTSSPGKEERKREWWDTHQEDFHDL
ncbi:hypothetical protein KC327_g15494 [Hortaea werneckii]|uniref:G-protein coupled receptors family 1 profile domain-containing protein n=1 Tax=Hortaea werneckii EXF-2000 TaxID=1157616 RepID=A0A1Z5TLS6_HORWE|nr:hypothetical protein KC358_g9471 [Hortaea werneckii]OTA36992.1 hypothetical protein BTJ68_02357 [Hortaea werneckii EXF-2000]KAI6922912.1 hypothetical protein KC348_g9652 [Hortaea werneckii]KAI6932058.1 hypothetical protein KC341_g9218 [Hortaea werneckii]KAI6964446.1 hypothetical protein KC321_g10668 [Hortaea werneckii]